VTDDIPTAAVHHVALTVSDVERSRTFYTQVLGFREVAPLPNGVLLGKGAILLGIRTAMDASRSIAGDSFNENRLGLDQLSFGVGGRADLERAVAVLDGHGVRHGEITEAPEFGLVNLFFRDPDNIQLELTAPFA
jgi:catechol 2,3-dioxygenase-like lactoylglutathione lyase family enzyme